MRQHRHLKLRAIAALAAVIASMLVGTPANASHYHVNVTGTSCPSGRVCAWALENELGSGAGYIDSEDNWDHTANHGSWDRITSSEPELDNFSWSVRNNGTGTSFEHVRLYLDYGYGGFSFCLPKGGHVNLVGTGWEDNISSHRWFDGTNCTGAADGESHPDNDVH
jgi:hypothetical protein